MCQPVSGERAAFALQSQVGRLDQMIERHLLGVVIAADKTVFGKARPARRGGRQPCGKQGGKIEAGRHWSVPLSILVRLPALRRSVMFLAYFLPPVRVGRPWLMKA